MQRVVTVRFLRQRLSDYVERAAAGETILVLRHGHPVAVLRPPDVHERVVRLPVNTLRTHIRQALRIARRRPVLLTWRGTATAVVGPPPEDVESFWEFEP